MMEGGQGGSDGRGERGHARGRGRCVRGRARPRRRHGAVPRQPRDPAGAGPPGRQLRPDPRHHRRARAAAVPRRRRAARPARRETCSGSPGSPATCPRSSSATCGSTRSSAAGPRSSGRVAEDRRTQQITDVLGDQEYGRQDLQRLAGYRTLLAAPMVLGDEVVGVLTMWRTAVAPFSERDTRLLDDFAAQAAIALRQVELMRSLEARGAELASKVEQLEALRDARRGRQLQPRSRRGAPAEIVTNAVRLTGTDGGSIMEYDEATDTFLVRTAFGTSEALVAELRAITIRRDSTLVGRSATERRPLEISDLSQDHADPHLEAPVRRRLAIGARDPDGARGRDRGGAGHPSAVGRGLPRGDGGPARDLRVPVVGRHRQRPAVPRAGAEGRAARGRARGRRSDQLQPRPQRGSRAHPRQRGPPLQCRRGPVDRVRRGREDVRHPPRARRERQLPRSSGRADGRGGRADHSRPLRPRRHGGSGARDPGHDGRTPRPDGGSC